MTHAADSLKISCGKCSRLVFVCSSGEIAHTVYTTHRCSVVGNDVYLCCCC